MSRRDLSCIWLMSLALLSVVACSLENPGSLDACYHLHVAQNLAAGRGMVEDLIWNYLDKSSAAMSLPRPSHLYWMPMSTWLAWIGIELLSPLLSSFRAAQVPFVLLAALIPPLTYAIAWRLWQDRQRARMAALLCLLAPNYLEVWVVPEPVTPFCLSAAACFAATYRGRQGSRLAWLMAGVGAALAHLARADGALVFAAAALVAAQVAFAPTAAWRRALPLTLLGLGYGLIMTPWFARSYALLGTPLPSAPSRTAFMHRYDEIFSYALDLSAAHWWSADGLSLIAERSGAALEVLVQFFGTFQWVVPPLVLLGYSRAPSEVRTRVAASGWYALLLLPTMTLVFPHPAKYGTLFRAASALVPWGMALVPAGLDHAARAYAGLRRGCAQTALAVFRPGLIVAMALVAALFHLHRLHGILPQADRLWNQHLTHYREVADWLEIQGANGPVLVVDPPGYTLATGRPSIVVPSDGAQAVREAADRYGARWLLLEANVPSLEAAWRGQTPLEGFASVRSFRDEVGSLVRLMVRTP